MFKILHECFKTIYLDMKTNEFIDIITDINNLLRLFIIGVDLQYTSSFKCLTNFSKKFLLKTNTLFSRFFKSFKK